MQIMSWLMGILLKLKFPSPCNERSSEIRTNFKKLLDDTSRLLDRNAIVQMNSILKRLGLDSLEISTSMPWQKLEDGTGSKAIPPFLKDNSYSSRKSIYQGEGSVRLSH